MKTYSCDALSNYLKPLLPAHTEELGESVDVDDSRLLCGILLASDLEVQELTAGTVFQVVRAAGLHVAVLHDADGLGHRGGNQKKGGHVGLHRDSVVSK